MTAVAWDALTRARELVGQLDWERTTEELDRVQAGIKHELETALAQLKLEADASAALVSADTPGLVRNDHQETARKAATAIAVRSGTQRAAVLLHLYQDHQAGLIGSCDELISAVTGLGASSERPRRVELVNMGLVEPTGKTVRTSTNREAMTWRITHQGVMVARKLEIQDPLPFADVFAEPSTVKPEEAQVPEVAGPPEILAQVRRIPLE